MGELAKERRGVAAAVEEMGATPVWFEILGGPPGPPTTPTPCEAASGLAAVVAALENRE